MPNFNSAERDRRKDFMLDLCAEIEKATAEYGVDAVFVDDATRAYDDVSVSLRFRTASTYMAHRALPEPQALRSAALRARAILKRHGCLVFDYEGPRESDPGRRYRTNPYGTFGTVYVP